MPRHDRLAKCVIAGPSISSTPYITHTTPSDLYSPPNQLYPFIMSAQACIWKPNEHADEYIVFVEDVKEVSWGRALLYPLAPTQLHTDIPCPWLRQSGEGLADACP